MKRLVAFLLLLLLASCIPTKDGRPILSGQRLDAGTVQIEAYAGPTLVASSSQTIFSFEPGDVCQYQETSAGPNNSVKCDVPEKGLKLLVYTEGAVSTQLVNGYIPVTRPVPIP